MLGKENQCIMSRGMKHFEHNGDVYIFVILPEYFFFFI